MSEVTRRALLGGALTSTAILASTSLRGQQAQGQPQAVFLDYDQEALDRAYDQIPWAPNMDEVFERRDQKGELARARLGSPQRFSYGPSEIEKLDVYVTNAALAPIHVFVHGGAWQFGGARGEADLAEMNVDAGVNFVAIDFTNVIETEGDLFPLAQQVRRAVAWVFENAGTFGGDAQRLYVSGHSSGGHLAGVVMTTDWVKERDLPGDLVKGGFLVSGMYDLHPVSLSSRSTYVNFTDDVIEDLSPLRHIDKLAAPVTVAYGTQETPEFQRQSREFAAAIAEAGKPVTLLVAEGYNHFEIAEDLGNPYGVVGRSVLAQIRRA
jgi:arylformamidase